jgi:putative DNA primase/helicase
MDKIADYRVGEISAGCVMNYTKTADRARGRYREILPYFGIPIQCLTNKKGPCPICGGKDRFRFDDRDGDGTYFCNQCTERAGNGILLLRRFKKWDHKTACDAIDRLLGETPANELKPAGKGNNEQKTARRLANIERTLKEAINPTVLRSYLVGRGLSVSSPVLRGHTALPYFDENNKVVGRFPAVVAPILALDGSLQSLQRVYDASLDPRKKTMPPVSTITGAAVRLFEPAEEMAIGEGFETCLAAYELFGFPIWAGLSANGLETMLLPPFVKRLHIFADNDASMTGQHAAFTAAKRHVKAGLAVEVHVPERADTDWLDVLNQRKGAGT